jgi:hypothetical protein
MAVKKRRILKKKKGSKNPAILLNKLAGPMNDYRINYLIWGGERERERDSPAASQSSQSSQYSDDLERLKQKELSIEHINRKDKLKTRPLSSESKTLSDILQQRVTAPLQVPESENPIPVKKLSQEKRDETSRQSFASITVS